MTEGTYYAKNRKRLKARRMERYYENRDAILAANLERYAIEPEYRDRVLNHCKKQYQKNPEPFKENAKRWAEANVDRAKELAAARIKRHRKLRPDLHRMNQARRRARIAESEVGAPFTVDDVFARGFGLCGICGDAVDPSDMHVDHIIPLAKGGSHTIANVQIAHPVCNLRKGAKVLCPHS